MAGRPKIALLLTGGTIAMLGRDRLDFTRYYEEPRRLSAAELLARVPELSEIADVREVPYEQVSGPRVGPEHWLKLAQRLQRLFSEDEVTGAVVTHGTNTLEETAYFLTLTLKTDRPIVVTGSVRPVSTLSSDADLNLLNGVRTACAPDAVGKGVLVVLNDTIHSARQVTKGATYRVQAFESRDTGPLGYADADGRVVFYMSPSRAHTLQTPFDVTDLAVLPRVDITVSYAGQDGCMIDAAVAAKAEGIIVAGTGSGTCTPLEDQAVDKAIGQGLVIVQTSRVGAGRVVSSPRLRERGIVAADNLGPWKARVLLMLALTITRDINRIQSFFDTY